MFDQISTQICNQYKEAKALSSHVNQHCWNLPRSFQCTDALICHPTSSSKIDFRTCNVEAKESLDQPRQKLHPNHSSCSSLDFVIHKMGKSKLFASNSLSLWPDIRRIKDFNEELPPCQRVNMMYVKVHQCVHDIRNQSKPNTESRQGSESFRSKPLPLWKNQIVLAVCRVGPIHRPHEDDVLLWETRRLAGRNES